MKNCNILLTEKQEKYQLSALSSGKTDKYEYLTGEQILPPDKRRVIEQAKLAYFPLGKAFGKQIKTIEEEDKNQIKVIKDHGKQFAESNEKILLSTEIVHHLMNKEKFNKLVEEKYYEFQNLKEKINPNNLIYNYKTEGKISTDFSDYQNPIDIFINLSDGNVNPREVLKNQIEFKSDIDEIKKKKIHDQNQNAK